MDSKSSTPVREDVSREGIAFKFALPTSRDDVLVLVAGLLGEDPDDIDPDENLIECGIDSVGVMQIVDTWHRQGLHIRYAELFERPTVTDWWRLLSERGVETRKETAHVAEVDVSAPFELSPIQHAYWVGRGDDQPLGGVGCHVYLEIDGVDVDPVRLERAVFAVAQRHPMLRVQVLGDGTQQIRERSTWPGLRVHDVRESPTAAKDLAALREGLSHRRLEVERGEVFDVQLSLLPGGATRLHIELDLLVADVLSFNVFLNDLALAYREGPAALRPLSYTYPRYCAELAALRADEVDRDRQYWAERLDELPAAPQLPLTVEPALFGRPKFRRVARWIEPTRYRRLIERAREEQVTVAMTLATMFAEVLGRWSGMSRLLLNVPVFDRKTLHPDVPELIADFTNLVLLEVDLGAAEFVERVRATQRRFQTDISHVAYSGLDVLRDLTRRGDHAGAPVVFAANLNSGDLLSSDFRESFGELGFMISQTPQVWLDHQLMEMDGGLYLNWDYVDGLCAEGVVPAMFEAYVDLVNRLIDEGWAAPARIPLPEGQAAVRAVVGTPVRSESGRVLHGAFFERAVCEPDRVALLWGVDGELSYGGLARWALRVAGELVACGVRPGDAVAVSVAKGPAQVAAILGVLAAGGVYVPCGVDQPLPRRERMLAAAGVRVGVGEGVGLWPEGVRGVDLDGLSAEPLAAPVEVSGDASAYVIFTSGSTGVPKGVEVSHRSAVNTVEDVNERFLVGPEDRVLAVSAADFDLSVYDMFGLLGVGGALVLVEEGDRREARRWVELCRRHGVTVWNSVPALFDMYLTVAESEGVGDRIRLVLVSGDWVGLDLPGRFRARCADGRFVALGGATEAAIWSNAFEVESVDPRWRSIPYGFALSNQCYRVVDSAGRDCPDWVAGELWIGGVGVAVGYRGDPEKTAEKFVWWEGQRWYRTGDLGRFWPDGTLEFLGRSDLQVKVRGHRIELGEIEAVLEGHPWVDRAVAVTIGTGAHRKLAAAITTAHQGAVPVADGIAALDLPSNDGPAILADDDRELETAVVEIRIASLIAAGLGSQPATPDDIAAALDLDATYRDLLRLWLDWLTERAVLAVRAGRYEAGERWAEVRDPQTWTATIAAAEGTWLHAVAVRLAAVEDQFAEILRGERAPLTLLEDPVLSPEALVIVQPDTEAAIDRIARTVARLAAGLGRRIRLADLGCRTGMAAHRLLARLDRDQVEPTLLDSSPRLLELAADRLAGGPHAPRLRTVTDPLLPPDLRHNFDVVVMTGALHRYGDPVDGAAQAAELLAPRGLLIGIEHRELAPVALLTAAVLGRGFGGSRRGPMRDAAGWTEVLAAAHLREIDIAECNSALLLLTARSAADRPIVREDEVLAELRRELPAHMVPERLAVLFRLPLSGNGKVDRKRVAELLAATTDREDSSEPPRTETERMIAQMWGELLSATDVGRHANFFALGGDSLTATQFAEALLARTGVTLPLRQMFAEPTVAAVADAIASQLDDSTEEGTI